ncbi:EMILIN-2 [Denticeps clupeoides]|nr:EMILIN-2-like [Denticeps clupeoides]
MRTRGGLSVFCMIVGFSLTGASPSGAHRHRSRNWCAFIVQKNVSCAVQGSVESFVEPGLGPCPPHLPDCEQKAMYRTRSRPTYKIAYKAVTELEWRCCPGFQGPDCRERKDASTGRTVPDPQSYPRPRPAQTRHPQRAERRDTVQHEVRSGNVDKTQKLEEEVQRLSQTVLDLQAAMTGVRENLRMSLQEDTSKMLVTLLNNLQPPDGARAEQGVVHLDGHQATRGRARDERGIEEVIARLDDVTDALKSKDKALEDLRGTVTGHDGQIRMLMDASQGPPISSGASSDLDVVQVYIDGKFENLRKELAEDIEQKLSYLKSTCDEKILSVQKTCEEGQENGYFNLNNLLETKEAELRKEISSLRQDLGLSEGLVRTNRETAPSRQEDEHNDLRREVQRLAEAHRVLNARVDNELQHLSMIQLEDIFGPRVEELEDRMNVTQRNAELYSFYVEEKLSKAMADEVATLRKLLENRLESMEDQFTVMLVEMSNNSYPGMYMDSMDGLQNEINSNKYLIQGLEDRMNAIGDACATKDCKPGLDGLDGLMKDVQNCRNSLDVMNTDLRSNADKIKEVELLVGGLSVESKVNGRNVEDLENRFTNLKDNVDGLSGSVKELGGSINKFSLDLQNLSATCCLKGQMGPGQEEAGASKHQMEELRNRLEKLAAQMTSEYGDSKKITADVLTGASVLDTRLTALEVSCRRLDAVSRSLQKMDTTLGTHTGDIVTLQDTLQKVQAQLSESVKWAPGDPAAKEPEVTVLQQVPVGPIIQVPHRTPHIHIPLIVPPARRPPTILQQPPRPPSPNQEPPRTVVETGEAGPPGYQRRVTVRRDRGTANPQTPSQGFAGAPGYPPVNPASFRTDPLPLVRLPYRPAAHLPAAAPVLAESGGPADPFSFSAGLTRQPFSGDFSVVRFDRVLVNDGEHYSPRTGIFTVPMDGRYLVTVVLTALRGERVEAVLSVSNRSVQKLDSAGYQRGDAPWHSKEQCACGGSASFNLILSLRRGDRVGVVRTAGQLAISESREMLSTFSGVFLYPATPAR